MTTAPWAPLCSLGEHDLPACPTDALGHPLADFVEELARDTRTPRDLPAVLTLCTASAALLGKVEIVGPRWTEPVALYGLAVLPSGAGKSPVFARVVAPLREIEAERRRAAQQTSAAQQAEREVLEERLGQAKRLAAHVSETDKSAALEAVREAAMALDRCPAPADPGLFVDDATPEALALALERQRECAALFAPEGGAFGTWAGRYSGMHNFEVVLRAHSGESLRVDRVGRAPVVLERPLLTIAVTVQPHVLECVVADREFVGRGLLARFLVVMPDCKLGFRPVGPRPMRDDVAKDYEATIRRLAALPDRVDTDGRRQSRRLTLEVGACEEFETFCQQVEVELRPTPPGRLAGITAWASKLAGTTLRLAAILHAVDHVRDDGVLGVQVVDRPTMRRAVRLAQTWLVPHARVAFGRAPDSPHALAHRLLGRWLETKRGTWGEADMVQALKRHAKADEVRAALALLAKRGYVRCQPPSLQPLGQAGRTPSPTWELRPEFLEHASPEPPAPHDEHAEGGSPHEPALASIGLSLPLPAPEAS